MQNGKQSPHLGQVEGILNSGVLLFLALAACSGETVRDRPRCFAKIAFATIRHSFFDLLDVLNLFP
jgi:hypothetical protein